MVDWSLIPWRTETLDMSLKPWMKEMVDRFLKMKTNIGEVVGTMKETGSGKSLKPWWQQIVESR
jgi:hypothetical protein